MFTADDCIIAKYILEQKRFEPMSMRIWCRLARSATGIIDIGANVGIYTLAAAALRSDIKIHAFEPNPHAFSRLRVHKRLNKFPHIMEYTIALAESSRIDRLSWARKARKYISSGGTLARTSYENCDTVPCDVMPLDAFAISVGSRGLVKIDVEGAEQAVIFGMTKELSEKPDILLELMDTETCRLINKRIVPLGYRAYEIDETAMTIRQLDELTPARLETGHFNRFLSVHEIHPEEFQG
jgi:FkbM family methyltransferase